MDYDVFLSYHSEDSELAELIAEELRESGLEVWFDKRTLRGGDDWQIRLNAGIHESKSFAVLIGPAGIGPWHREEILAARRKCVKERTRLIPVILPGVVDADFAIPDELKGLSRVDCREESLGPLIEAILGSRAGTSMSQFGIPFHLAIPSDINPQDVRRKLLPAPNPNPNPNPELLYLSWRSFGRGVDHLRKQIEHAGTHYDVEACFGINDAGLVMATFLNSKVFGRKKLGYIKCEKEQGAKEQRTKMKIVWPQSYFPKLKKRSAIALFDFEVKREDVLGYIWKSLRRKYAGHSLAFYFVVFGALVEHRHGTLRIESFDQLVSAGNLKKLTKLGLKDVFIACTMYPWGIEPPLDLR